MSDSEGTTRRPRVTSSRFSRRGFLRAAGAGTALAVGTPLLASAQEATPSAGPLVATTLPSRWDREADVVVVGTGAAAFSAAVTAAQAGAEVVILEKAANPGGTTLISGNGYWIPNNSKMRAKGLTDPREDALKLMARLSYPQLYDPEMPTFGLPQLTADLQATYYDTAAGMIDTYEEWGALYSMIQPGMGYSGQPADIGDPEYHAELPENKAPNGRLIMADASRGEFGTIPQQMQKWTDTKGVPVLTEHRVVGAFQNRDGAVVGVQVENNGTQLAIRARKAVVFGSGGFTQDPIKALNYLRGPVFAGCGVPTNTGDFVDIGLALGARFGNMNQAWWLQCPLELALKSPALPGADIWMPYGDSMVIVNKYGNRVTSEKRTYNERGQSHHYYDPARTEYPNLVQFMIYDDAVAQDPTQYGFRFPIPAAGQDSDYVIKGDTWEDLAANIAARLDSVRGQASVSARVGPEVKLADDFVDKLGATIQRFNGFAETGVDEDFGRGSTPIQVAWGSGTARFGQLKNPTMAPFRSEGPYYCIMVGGMTLDTKGGPVIDTGSRVIHASGQPIPGLYGAGNCVASPTGQAYWSGGATLGPALTFGHIAGKNAVAEPEKSID
ncbi:MAG: 3-oxosteroid 1-dehydrogenase [Thermomicrobiales bacterium]|nr:3-oxosteroid 1-dehydrogenase [Thermomicrobiales bacterium]MEA2529531.1 3-oxosteroid 1-dehydrogenase [Thermomicrobiales bacterium]